MTLFQEKPLTPFIVTNGDLFSDINFSAILDFHQNNNADATMAVKEQKLRNPFGVIETKGLEITKIETEIIEQAEIEIKYGGYLNKEKESAEKSKRLEGIRINADLEYEKLHSISSEGREKLKLVRPITIGQASRISGVSPSDINVLLIYLGR